MTTSVQAISRIIGKLEISRSEEARGRVSTVTNEGFKVSKNLDGQIVVDYISNFGIRASEKSVASYKEREKIALVAIYELLVSKGFWIDFDDCDRLIVTKAVA